MYYTRVVAVLLICCSPHITGYILPNADFEEAAISGADQTQDVEDMNEMPSHALQDDIVVKLMESNEITEMDRDENEDMEIKKAYKDYLMGKTMGMSDKENKMMEPSKDMVTGMSPETMVTMHVHKMGSDKPEMNTASTLSKKPSYKDLMSEMTSDGHVMSVPDHPSQGVVFTGKMNTEEMVPDKDAAGYTEPSNTAAGMSDMTHLMHCFDNGGNEGTCLSVEECAALLDKELIEKAKAVCVMSSETQGVCCPDADMEEEVEKIGDYWKKCKTSRDKPGKCMSFEECFMYHNKLFQEVKSTCAGKGNTDGVCCSLHMTAANTTKPMPTAPAMDVDDQPPPLHSHSRRKRSVVYSLSLDDLNVAGRVGLDYVTALEQRERELLYNGVFRDFGRPPSGHRKYATKMAAFEVNRAAEKVLAATREIVRTKGIYAKDLRRYSVEKTILEDTCPPNPYCDYNTRYRFFDGSCNNLQRSKLGMSFTPNARILPPAYQDGVSTPRVATDGNYLPGSRLLRQQLMPEVERLQQGVTLMLTQWGQFVAHDLSHIPLVKFSNGSNLRCCSRDGRLLPAEYLHPSCFPMLLEQSAYHGTPQKRCMHFARSTIAPNLGCTFGYAEQMNQVTHYLDGSTIYGSTEEDTRWLRSFQGGRLRVFNDNGRYYLPLEEEHGECTNYTTGIYCFRAGDNRVNEQPGLTLMHTIWMREHNRVATLLRRLNHYWSDETLFQQARRIVIAELQHITYTDFLTLLLGPTYMLEKNLRPLQSGYRSSSYDPTDDPTVTNEFSTAAFRFGHTQVTDTMWLVNEYQKEFGSLRLRDTFFSPNVIREPGVLEGLVRGMLRQQSERFDQFFTHDVTELLFKNKRGDRGTDLPSRNIQRGRDHGLPGYNAYRESCKMASARTFYDFGYSFPKKTLALLSQVYRHVDDIDLFVGGVAETPVKDGILGPTFQCIVGDQFVRLKSADRFFYDVTGYVHSFTNAQLRELRKASLARILCDNTGISYVQRNVFRIPSKYNAVVPCRSVAIPRVNLVAWRVNPRH